MLLDWEMVTSNVDLLSLIFFRSWKVEVHIYYYKYIYRYGKGS